MYFGDGGGAGVASLSSCFFFEWYQGGGTGHAHAYVAWLSHSFNLVIWNWGGTGAFVIFFFNLDSTEKRWERHRMTAVAVQAQ